MWITASVPMRADPPKHTLCIVEDVSASTDAAVVSEWRAEVAEFGSLLEQVARVGEDKDPDYTFRQFAITKVGSGDALKLTHRAWFRSRDADAAEVRPPSKCDPCPLSHVRRLFRETVQTKLFDAEHGLYRPYAVSECVRDKSANVAIAVQPANGLRLEPDIIYIVGEWVQFKGKPKRLLLSLVSLDPWEPGSDRLHATFEVHAPTEEIRDDFRRNDCSGVPPNPIVLVPRLVMPLPTGTLNVKVQ
jgi:uncharacterized protein YecT (DUF1311 family)